MESSTVTMAGFADMLTNILQMGGGGGRQVVDMTDLKGNYQVAVEISLADLMAMAGSASARHERADAPGGRRCGGRLTRRGGIRPRRRLNVFASVKKLGLKLEPRKAPVEQLVIDHVEKAPTAN